MFLHSLKAPKMCINPNSNANANPNLTFGFIHFSKKYKETFKHGAK